MSGASVRRGRSRGAGAALLASALLGATALSACSKDPCDGKSGICISAHVDGNAQNLSQLLVTLDGTQTMPAQPSSGTVKLPVQFAVLVGTPPASSPFKLRVDGLRGGAAVASDEHDVTLGANGRASVSFRLDETVPGGGGGDGSVDDMAVANAPTLAGADPVTVDELQPIDVTMTATDPLGGSVALSAANLPGNAKFDNATGHFTWTPGYTDAGTYTVKVTVTPGDPARVATYDFNITVKNAADPIVINGSAALGAVPIGDWDKDGFGDLAVCTGDAAGATGKYHVKIIYGAATGLPLDAASAAGRVDSFDLPATYLGGPPYSCRGGDYDGDGHADIIFADPNNDYWHGVDSQNASPKQGGFMVMFGGARGAVPPTITIVGNENFGNQLGAQFTVGDFNGDGKADIATTWAGSSTTYALFVGSSRINVTSSSNELDYPASSYLCHDPISIAFTDFDKDGKADWVLEDPGINMPATPPSTCDPTAQAAGGIRVIKGTNANPLLSAATADEGTRWEQYYAPTAVPAASRSGWATQGAGCDVDNDGYGDLGTLWTFGTVANNINGEVFYGGASGIQATAKMPLPSAAGNNLSFAGMQPPRISCFDAYKGKPALVVSQGFDTPGTLHLFAGKPLAEVGTMSSPDPGDAGFGAQVYGGTHEDVDGDGKEDLVVISNQFGWVIYGR